MSTFDQDEASVQNSKPVEFYDIVLSTGVTYRIASGNRDVQVGSNVYTAEPAARSNRIVDQPSQRTNLTLSIRATHPLVDRWFQLASPPKSIVVTVYRKQLRSGLIERIGSGSVAAISVEGNIAKLTIVSKTLDTLQRMLPTISSGTTCAHILYDSMCKVDRASFVVTTTSRFVDGREVHVDLGDFAKLGTWCVGGELLHVPTGGRMTIAAQKDVDPATSTLTVLTMQLPVPELRYGDAIQVYAGCAHDIITCNQKFANQPNFFGEPYKPTANPFLPTGLGTVEQT